MKLNEYLREVVGLRDTKVMCYEGGCGSCLVVASMYDPATSKNKTVSINSCLCPVYSCDGWNITTTAGIGNQHTGFHPIQQKLAEHNGSQCGYCSPGMVMNMYGFLQEHPNPTKEQIEDAFDGNICRCTGYRAILDAMQTFSGSAMDIEDLGLKSCKGKCGTNACNRLCDADKPVHMVFSSSQWYKPKTLSDLRFLMQQFKGKKKAYVVGGTNLGYGFDVYIDTKGIKELYSSNVSSSPAVFGANITLNEFIGQLMHLSDRTGFEYCLDFVEHLKKVANRPVRNVASLGGNLMWKYTDHAFPSDIFLLLETASASITLMANDGTMTQCSPEEFLSQSMTERIIYSVSLPAGQTNQEIRTYKVMPRNQSSLAHVNAGFNMIIDKNSGYFVTDHPSMVFGGISGNMNHAVNTEHYLVGQTLLDPSVLQDAFNILLNETVPDPDPSEPSPAYRKSLVVSLFYKFILSVCDEHVAERIKSGALPLVRPVSSGTETYDTDQSKWPLTEPLPKITSKLQAAGEALYVNDIPAFAGEVYAEFVVSTKGNAKIQNIDPSKALQIPGVLRFISVADLPFGGVNNYMVPPNQPEELFCSGQVLYAGQALGLIIADTKGHAIEGATAVEVSYIDVRPPILTIKDAIAKQSLFPKPANDIVVGNAEAAIAHSPKKVTGEVSMADQYHFHLETQSCIAVPKEDGIDLYPTSQWADLSQAAAAMVLGVSVNSINVTVKRLGGAYGGKISRNFQVGAAAALAAQVMNRPVRIFMTLAANMQMMGKRYPYMAQYQVGLTNDGMLNGVKINYFTDCGCSPNENAVSTAMTNGDNAYFCANWHMVSNAVKTNLPCTTAMRAPGWLPGIFIMEHVMEHCSKKLGIDPVVLRRKNLVKNGQATPGGQVLDHCKIDQLMDNLTTSAEVTQRLADIRTFNQMNRWKKKGLSVMPMKYGVGWNGANYNVYMTLYHVDGTVAIAHGGIESGQGINTKVAQVCAFELGIPLSKVTVKSNNTLVNSNSITTGGSITSELCCKGIITCCEKIRRNMAPVKAKMHNPTWLELVQQCYADGVDLAARHWVDTHVPTPTTYQSYGVTCTEMELDVLTGENQINRVDILFDCGDSMNPDIDIGQIHGAFVMGLGYFLLEKLRYDPVTGENVSASTWIYKPPMSKDIPVNFKVSLLKNTPNPHGVLGSKAVGEPPLCMSSSVLFALKHAIEAARKEIQQDIYFPLDVPTTVDLAQQSCLVHHSQFVLN